MPFDKNLEKVLAAMPGATFQLIERTGLSSSTVDVCRKSLCKSGHVTYDAQNLAIGFQRERILRVYRATGKPLCPVEEKAKRLSPQQQRALYYERLEQEAAVRAAAFKQLWTAFYSVNPWART